MLQLGDKLPNGAVVIEDRRVLGDTNIILANTGSYTPFVTWAYYRNDPRSTSSGHYFKTYSEALEDFKSRCGRSY